MEKEANALVQNAKWKFSPSSVMIDFVPNDFFSFLFFAVAVGFAFIGGALFRIRRKINALYGNTDATDANMHTTLIHRVATLEMKIRETEPRLDALEKISLESIRRIGFLRFNPFRHTGGNTSFVLSLLDGKKNGIIISSLSSRDGVRLYAKEVRGGRSRSLLTEEEKKALESGE
jgi:hypothetical protein